MNWYLLQTKPRQERLALLNLEQQGYESFLPLCRVEKVRRERIGVIEEPLFPRYLFVRLDSSQSGKSWSPIRSTRGVSKLVTFGQTPAKVNDELIRTLKCCDQQSQTHEPQPLFREGQRLLVTQGPFAGLEAVYQMSNGESRVMVLINILSKPVKLLVTPGSLQKLSD